MPACWGRRRCLPKTSTNPAFFAAATAKFSHRYIQSFGKDAYCQEGLGYWGYGFGNYIMICELLSQATGGKLDLYQDPAVRAVGLFPSATRSPAASGRRMPTMRWGRRHRGNSWRS